MSVLLDVYLGALKFSAVIDVHRLPLCKDVEHRPAAFAVTVAGSFDTTERHMRFGTDGRSVDVCDARPDIPDCLIRSIDILRVDRRREPVWCIVGDPDRLLKRMYLQDREDRSENFLAGHSHQRRHSGKNRRFEKPAVPALIRRLPRSSRDDLRSLLLSYLNVLLDGLNLLLVDDRADVGICIQTIAEFQRFGFLQQNVHKLIVHFLMDNQPGCRRASLTRRAERAPEDTFEGQIKISIVHDDLRVLSAHFECNALAGAAEMG